MKHWLICFISYFSFINFSLCQNKEALKLEQAFGKERLNYLKNNYPDSIAYYEFILQNGYRITEKKYAKPEEIASATPIQVPSSFLKNGIINFEDFNLFLLPVKFSEKNNNVYSIEGTEYLLMLRSKEYLQRKFNAKP